MADSIYPNSLEDVIALIHRLYQPGSPQDISRIQDILQTVQRSPEGWQLADSLLSQPDSHVQFFGALTFTVKLNNDWSSLPESEIPNLRSRLLGWLVRLVCGSAGNLVVRKLCSTLVTFFIRFPESFAQPVRLLLCALAVGRAGTMEEFAVGVPETEVLLRTLPEERRMAALGFCAMLVEEVGKVDANNIKNTRYHAIVHENTAEAVLLMRSAIDISEGANRAGASPEVVEAGLKTFQAWVYYTLRTSITTNMEFPLLQSLTRKAIDWMMDAEHYDVACEVVIDILSQSFAFFTHEDTFYLANVLVSPWAMERYNSLLTGDNEWEAIQFSRLLVTFAEATVQELAETLETPHGHALISMLHGLLTVPGYPRVQDEISSTTFEFFGSLVDYILDSDNRATVDGKHEQWVERGKAEVQRAVDGFWRKIRIPPQDVAVTWSKDQRDGFMHFRRDAADFVDAAYALLGSRIFEQLVDQVVGSLGDRQPQEVAWDEVESSLFCLKALSDNLGDEPDEDEYLEKLFGSKIFSLLVEYGDGIPSKVRTTCVSIIGSYASFFERKTQYLPAALNFLFTSLSTSILAVSASRSISLLCYSCRSTLTQEIPAFLHQYGLFAHSPAADDAAKERVLCAISYVIQALPNESDKLEPITSLLTYINTSAQSCLSHLASHNHEAALEAALQTLSYLTSMGKGLQAPDDVPIDLSPHPATTNFYSHPPGSSLQTSLFDIITTIISSFPGNGELVDSACAIFRTGFTETQPGLFCFSPDTITSFLLSHAWRTETMLSAATCFVSSHTIPGSTDITPQIRSLLQFVHSLVTSLESPQQEPEIAQYVIEFLARLFRRYLPVLLDHPQVQDFFMFTLAALSVREPLVKKSAASFWSNFLVVSADGEEGMAEKVEEVVEGCGPRLCQQLVWAVGGGCQRSEVEAMTEVIRKVVVRHRAVKGWLMAAVEGGEVGGKNVKPVERRQWVDKIVNLRGKRITVQACKEFWLKCRGSEFDYAS